MAAGFRFDVFLSHASEDKDDVRAFARLLEAAGLRVWLDEEQLPPGLDPKQAIVRGLEASRHALVWVTDAWLRKSWTQWELELFAKARSEERRVLPVLRVPWDDAVLGPYLTRPVVVTHERRGPGLLWLVLCGVRGEAPGPRDSWGERGEELLRGKAVDGVSLPGSAAARLQAAYRRRRELRKKDADTAEVDAEILQLKRELRHGPTLHRGEFLGDGRFQLEEKVGRGGFATVWKAFDSQADEWVAIKVLHGELAQDASRRQRLFRGARKMAALRYPQIVRVVLSEAEEDGFHYYVMEYVAGGDLHRAVLEERVDAERGLAVVESVAAALEEAHRCGLVHRDVKPQNILLRMDGTAALSDFDLVHALDTTGGTRTGAMGTVLYAAPEQHVKAKAVDHRADVYGLGMTAVFCVHGDALPPAAMYGRDAFLKGLPCAEPVRRVLQRAVALKVEERFESMASFRSALGAARASLGESNSQPAAPVPSRENPVAQAPEGRPRVYLIHRKADAGIARTLATALRRDHGVDVWFDGWEILPGDNIIAKMEHGLANADGALMLLSEEGLGERWAYEEYAAVLRQTIEGNRFVIPVMCGQPASVPSFLASRLVVDHEDHEGIVRAVLGHMGYEVGDKPALGELRTPPPPSREERQRPPDGGSVSTWEQVVVSSSVEGRGGDEELLEELAKVFWGADEARLVAKRAGFPRSRIPEFRTSAVFWSSIVEAALDGVVPGGVRAIVEQAAKMYRHNSVFKAALEPKASSTRVVHGVELVRIPAGSFLMGSPDDEKGRLDREGPQHRVELEEFFLARTPVTNEQYREYLEAKPDARKPRFWDDQRYSQANQPVVGVSWHDAQAYCEWAGLRLPTEAQWEYACRAGGPTAYHSGSSEGDLARVGWFSRNSDGRLHRVGELEPNAWGLYDMHGNVYEWCQDAFASYETRVRARDGSRKEFVGGAFRVVRGGVFYGPARIARSAYRSSDEPDLRDLWLGFRPAWVAEGRSHRSEAAAAGSTREEATPTRIEVGEPGGGRGRGRTSQSSEAREELIVAPRGGVELVRIPAGSFLMGSPEDEEDRREDEGPQHRVKLAEFCLALTPVTNAQYREFVEMNPGVAEPEHWGDRRFRGDNRPVVGVSWEEARAYCEWAGLRLPTEAQWEYACRAGTTTRYHSGNGVEDLDRVGWYRGNSGGGLHAVGLLAPNAWGLYDMHGNIWEWCEDNWVGNYEGVVCHPGDGSRTRPVGGASRVVRGGRFNSTSRNARSASRYVRPPDIRFDGLGFRPACSVPPRSGHQLVLVDHFG